MNASGNINFEQMLELRLSLLQEEHASVDAAVCALEGAPHPDQLELRRLKKQKLALKDMMAQLKDRLFPDIIA